MTVKQRFDRALINDFKETDEGYLTINACPVTRPGVFPYKRGDGVAMEAKLPDDLFSEMTIQSANAKPITDNHPTEAVTTSNYSKYSKGMTHTDAAVRNNKLVVSFTVTDAATIQKIKDGKRELSIGFEADVSDETGTYGGERYDSVQRNMKINHIALVDEGRAGPTVAIKTDSAFMMDSNDLKNYKNGGNTMPVLKIDNKDYEVDPVVKARVDALEAQLETANTKAGGVDSLTGERDALQAQVTTLTSELEEAKSNAMTADSVDKAVKERIELVEKAKPILGDSYDFTGKSEREVKEAAILTANKDFKGDGKSDDYINAFFDAMSFTKPQGFTQGARFNDAKDNTEAQNEEIEKMRQQRLNMNKKKEEN